MTLISFEEARAKASAYFNGRPVRTYGRGDENYFYISRQFPAGFIPNDGEVCAVQVNKKTGETTGVPPYPMPDCGFWTATEKYGDYPSEEVEDDDDDDGEVQIVELGPDMLPIN